MERSFPWIEIRQLHYFPAVAEEAGFAEAAAPPHKTQPALSVQIRQFERHVGAERFVRGRRQISLTAVAPALRGFVYAAVEAVIHRVAAGYAVSTDSPATLKVIAGHTVDLAALDRIDQLRGPGRYIRLELSGDSRDGRRS
jgi:DNA-binding transcriptional LysR family regulator